MKGYKGFNKDLTCRDFQYKEGETFETDKKIEVCDWVFRFCEYPLDCFRFYEPASSVFHEVEALGDIEKDNDSNDTKIATNKIKIGAKLNFEQLTKASIEFIYERTKKDNKKSAHKEENNSIASNSGYCSVSSNSGYCSVSSNSGYYSVSSNSGDHSVSSNSGDCSVSSNSGDYSVSSNSGYCSVSSNSGYCSVSSNSGEEGIALSAGIKSKAKGKIGTWLILAEWKQDENYEWHRVDVQLAYVDGEKIKEDTLYQLIDGKFVEVEDVNS